MKIFCIIPALNEAATIGRVLAEVKKYVDVMVVVSDGSTDETFNIAKTAGAVVLEHPTNRGQGAALETGDIYARNNGADIVVHFDADGQFFATEIKDVVAPLLSGEADAVFGSRFGTKKNNIPLFKRKFIIPVARLVNKVFFNLELQDPQSGFRALGPVALEKICIQQNGMAHCSEILHKISSLKLRVKEVPVSVIYEDFGQNFWGGVRIIKDTILNKLMN
jgi:glycosyltransferase involved in cell wall biosynthesis